MKKRILSMVIAVIMIIGIMPLNVFAEEAEALWGSSAGNLTNSGTLAEAVDAAEAGNAAYIKVNKSVNTEEEYLISAGEFTVDLNGFTVTCTGLSSRKPNVFTIKTTNTNIPKVVFTDSSENGTGKVVSNNGCAVYVNAYSLGGIVVTLEKGSYSGYTSGLCVNTKKSEVTVKSGVAVTASYIYGSAVTVNGGELTMEGGTLSGKRAHFDFGARTATDAKIDLSSFDNLGVMTVYASRKLPVEQIVLPQGYGLFDSDGNQYAEDAVSQGNIVTIKSIKSSYTVTVVNGEGSGDYEKDAIVSIKANAPAKGKLFAGWTSDDGVTFADATKAETTFAMPEKAVTVTATYKEIEYITLNLESPRGMKETITVDIDATVADLKAAVAEKCNVTFGEGSEYRLFGEDLKYPNSSLSDDTKILEDIGFENGQTIHLEKSTNWDASGDEPIKIFGLTITGGKGSQEPYGDYTNVDYYWNYYYKTITIRSDANITISGTGELNTNIIIKKAGNGKYTNLTIEDLSLKNDDGSCINVQGNSWVKLTVKGNNTLVSTGENATYTSTKIPALTLTNSGAYLKIMKASTGTLTATTNIPGQPGIGTYDSTSSVWGVEINGGTIIANGGEGAPGIRAQAVCIYGGTVTANGGIDGYGSNALYPYSIEILGGTITATSQMGKALTSAPNLDSYKNYNAVASENADGTNTVKYDSEKNDTYKYFKISVCNHNWGKVVYTWADNGCTATRTCSSAHVETATAVITSAQTKAPTTSAKGETTYTATFAEDWAETQTKTVADIPMLKNIKINTGFGGKVKVDNKTPATGEEVTVTVEPNRGYELKNITVTDENGERVKITDNGDGTFSFIQPAGDVVIRATFREIEKIIVNIEDKEDETNPNTGAPVFGIG